LIGDALFDSLFPRDRLIELEREKVIGKVAEAHHSFSYVNDIVRLLTEFVPLLLEKLKAASIDILNGRSAREHGRS